MLGWMLFIPVGFIFDPQFNSIGEWLLLHPSIETLWAGWYNAPVIALSNFNNTIVLGSFTSWLVLILPIFFISRIGVIKYREHIYDRLAKPNSSKRLKLRKCTSFTSSSKLIRR